MERPHVIRATGKWGVLLALVGVGLAFLLAWTARANDLGEFTAVAAGVITLVLGLPALRLSSRESSPCSPGKYTVGPEDLEPHLNENTMGWPRSWDHLHGSCGRRRGDQPALLDVRRRKALTSASHRQRQWRIRVAVLYRESKWDFRLEQVR